MGNYNIYKGSLLESAASRKGGAGSRILLPARGTAKWFAFNIRKRFEENMKAF